MNLKEDSVTPSFFLLLIFLSVHLFALCLFLILSLSPRSTPSDLVHIHKDTYVNCRYTPLKIIRRKKVRLHLSFFCLSFYQVAQLSNRQFSDFLLQYFLVTVCPRSFVHFSATCYINMGKTIMFF